MFESPLLDDPHRALRHDVRAWANRTLGPRPEPPPERSGEAARDVLALLAERGWLRLCVPAPWGDAPAALDVRALVMVREALAYTSGLADTQFAVQGLGSYPLALAAPPALQALVLPEVAQGRLIPAFALTEPEAGSDAAALRCSAVRDGVDYVLDGCKRFISNAGIASGYTVFARTSGSGAAGVTAFWVAADRPGLSVTPLHPSAPHPLGELRFDGVRVPAACRLGEEGQGFRVAMATLGRFRVSVGGAALGLMERALDESVARACARHQFGGPLMDKQGTAFPLADVACDLEAARGLVYRAAWEADRGGRGLTLAAAHAKLFATEAAFRAVDRAVQVFGGEGVLRGSVPERLAREVRALRIYEGTTEIQKVVIAQALARRHAGTAP